MTSENKPESDKVTLRQVAMSVLAAAFGVQSEEARQRDFTKGNPGVFIVAGIIFTVVFVLALIVVVHFVLKSAGS